MAANANCHRIEFIATRIMATFSSVTLCDQIVADSLRQPVQLSPRIIRFGSIRRAPPQSLRCVKAANLSSLRARDRCNIWPCLLRDRAQMFLL